ncbi:LacI family DNA-binding transcriptional regulator [Arthrobacter sp. ZGTC412]|uniref:LacI family DNA-binding transcriptional regulator n=1 Tax=Arthrobacter sp. ZGTC412 TaxID=2058900 RepID=UPI001C67127A|nr:LacI family DNA-binding transcriptional regulator [Arthrobacter sp. ZGTC412]
MARTTIVDIARDLGLSKTTVSSALNGTGRVSVKQKAAVHAAAARLGYVSNRAARSLRAHRMGAIGLYLPPAANNLDFYMDFAFGSVSGAAAHDCDLILIAREPSSRRSFDLDGAIVVDPTPDDPIVAALLDAGIPTVTVGLFSGPGNHRVRGTLESRHSDLQSTALDVLAERGRLRPALLAVDQGFRTSWALETVQTYRKWCSNKGIEAIVEDLGDIAEKDALAAAIEAAVDQRQADALLVGGQIPAGLCEVILESKGLVVGRDIDVAALVAARASDSALFIDMAPTSYGLEAVALLNDILEASSTEPVHRWFEGARLRGQYAPSYQAPDLDS